MFVAFATPPLRRLNHLDDLAGDVRPSPGTGYQPAAAEVPALVIISILQITSLVPLDAVAVFLDKLGELGGVEQLGTDKCGAGGRSGGEADGAILFVGPGG